MSEEVLVEKQCLCFTCKNSAPCPTFCSVAPENYISCDECEEPLKECPEFE